MAKRAPAEEASKVLSCQTWVLKVSIPCLGCKRKVKKVLQAIDDVYTMSIDSQHHRVTVTGNIEVQTLIKRLRKAGKKAEIWPEKVGTREEGTAAQNKHKPKDPNGGQSCNDSLSESTIGFHGNNPNEETENGGDPPEKSTSSKKFTAMINKGSEGEDARTGGKNKKKGKICDKGYSSSSATPAGPGLQNQILGMGHIVIPSNLTPTSQLSIPCPQDYCIPQVYASSYNIAHLSGSHVPLYGVQPSLRRYANGHQVTHLDSFSIFSDENVDGCSIM